MPPSGYSAHAVSGIAQFLRQTCTDLEKEVASGKHATLSDGFRYEVKQITSAVIDVPRDSVEWCILILTRQFYERAMVEGSDAALNTIEQKAAMIHISDEGMLTP